MKSPEYITHGAVSSSDADKIKEEGFLAEEGRATVSTDLIMAFKWASQKEKERASRIAGKKDEAQGRIIIMKTLDDVEVDYGLDTHIHVNKEDKTVEGFVSRYESGRRYLALYNKDEKDNSEIRVPAEKVLMSLVPSPELKEKLDELKEQIKKLEKIDLIKMTEGLVEVIKNNTDNSISIDTDMYEVIGNLVVSTIEAEVMSMVRGISLDVKRAKEYEIYNKDEKDTEKVDREELRQKLEKYKTIVESSSFDTGLDNLNRYIKMSINLLLRELKID